MSSDLTTGDVPSPPSSDPASAASRLLTEQDAERPADAFRRLSHALAVIETPPVEVSSYDALPIFNALNALGAALEETRAERKALIDQITAGCEEAADLRAALVARDADMPDTDRVPIEADRIRAGELSTVWPMSLRHPEDSIHLAIFVNDLLGARDAELAKVRSYLKLANHNAKRRGAEVTRLRAALEAIQWSGYSFIGMQPCPSCGNEEVEGHAEGCNLAAALGGQR